MTSTAQKFLTIINNGIPVSVVDSDFDFVPFTILKSGRTFRAQNFNLRTYANISVTTTYYLNTVTGSDANDGLSSANAKKTWNNIIATGDYDRIIIEDGSYLIRSESSSKPARDVEVIGQGTVYFTSDRSDALGAWSLAPAQTNTYQSSTGGQFIARVFDDNTLDSFGLPTALSAQTSIANVEANVGSFWMDTGTNTLYVHTFDSDDPTGQTNLKYYDSSACFWNVNSITIYIENVNFRGGLNLRNASATGGLSVYMKDCTGFNGIVFGLDEFIIQDSQFFSSDDDVINYDALNGIATQAIEIDCEFYRNYSGSTSQASTGHNGCKIVRINGEYHDVRGQCAAEANATTKAWLLGSQLYNSSVADVGYFTQGTSWLDSCTISGITSDLEAASGATINYRDLVSGGTFIGAGTIQVY